MHRSRKESAYNTCLSTAYW